MRLLIDECLSPRLAEAAHERGFEAAHVVWLGLSGTSDRDLMPTIVAGDWTFVTKNAVDFRGPARARGSRGLHARAALHAGLVCLNGPSGMDLDGQHDLFAHALDELEREPDLVNLALEVTLDGHEVVLVRYAIPAP